MDSPPPPNAAVRDMWSCDTLEKASALVRATTSDGAPGLVLQSYIANEFTAGSAVQHVDTVDPKTGRPFARVPISSEADVDRALDAATEAFGPWSKTPASVRSAHLLRVAALLREHRELFAVWESIDQGKTLERARVEVDRAVANFNYFATFILHQQTAARVVDGSNVLTYEHRSAAGVFALISPWNMPLYLLTWKVAPCLAFGCTAVAKPSELTSVTAVLLADVFRRAALPPGVVNLVLGDGPTTGAALVRSPRVRGVSFTGGTATGVQIRRATADQIGKHLSLELGGKNPTLVFDDVDLPKAVETAAMAAFENQGEICLCGSRIYVQATIYDAFVEAFAAHVRAQYQVGQRVGAVVSRAHYDKVRGYLVLAQEEGATFALGGVPTAAPADGLWIAPAVLTGVAAASRVARDEIFGPVVTVAPFGTEDEAVALANDNPNGLAAILLTRDAARIRRVGEQLDAGLVWANCWLVRELATPFGGMKQSGVGREGGEYSRDVFTNVRTLHIPM